MILKVLILILIIAGGYFILRDDPKPASTPGKSSMSTPMSTKAAAPAPTDHRSLEQWMADCRPVEARNTKTGVYTFWCSRVVNQFDKDQLLPAGWVRTQ